MPEDLKEILAAQTKILELLSKLELEDPDHVSPSERIAEWVVSIIGSWKFLVGQGCILVIYLILNSFWLLNSMHFDPYPFILLNLILSFQAAFTAPLILIAQNISARKDRRMLIDAYKTVSHIEDMMGDLCTKIERKKNGS